MPEMLVLSLKNRILTGPKLDIRINATKTFLMTQMSPFIKSHPSALSLQVIVRQFNTN